MRCCTILLKVQKKQSACIDICGQQALIHISFDPFWLVPSHSKWLLNQRMPQNYSNYIHFCKSIPYIIMLLVPTCAKTWTKFGKNSLQQMVEYCSFSNVFCYMHQHSLIQYSKKCDSSEKTTLCWSVDVLCWYCHENSSFFCWYKIVSKLLLSSICCGA